MAYTIATDVQDALDAPERYSAVLMTFTFSGAPYGLWTGNGPMTYNTILYDPGAGVFEISDFDQNADGSVSECTLTISHDPIFEQAADGYLRDRTGNRLRDRDGNYLQERLAGSATLLSLYELNWQFARVVIQLAMLDEDTGLPVGTILFIRGAIYEAPYSKGAQGEKIEIRVVSQGAKLSENGGMYRNAATQLGLDPADTALEGIGAYGAVVKKDIKWGQG